MIERKFIEERLKEFQIQEYISNNLKGIGHSQTKLVRTPLGEKIVVYASRPGLVVGRQGQNIKKLTETLKRKFKLENPQVEISEVEEMNLDANIVAERIASTLERFGSQKFKGAGHKTMSDVMNAGALGVEIVISGKLPSARAKSWRFYQGYLKKSGDISEDKIKRAKVIAHLKSGAVGIQVSILTPDIRIPDDIRFRYGGEESGKQESEKQGLTSQVEKTQKEKGKEGEQESPKSHSNKKSSAEKLIGEKKTKEKKNTAVSKKEPPEKKEGEKKKEDGKKNENKNSVKDKGNKKEK